MGAFPVELHPPVDRTKGDRDPHRPLGLAGGVLHPHEPVDVKGFELSHDGDALLLAPVRRQDDVHREAVRRCVLDGIQGVVSLVAPGIGSRQFGGVLGGHGLLVGIQHHDAIVGPSVLVHWHARVKDPGKIVPVDEFHSRGKLSRVSTDEGIPEMGFLVRFGFIVFPVLLVLLFLLHHPKLLFRFLLFAEDLFQGIQFGLHGLHFAFGSFCRRAAAAVVGLDGWGTRIVVIPTHPQQQLRLSVGLFGSGAYRGRSDTHVPPQGKPDIKEDHGAKRTLENPF
mmetsp:Transcript_56524/g.115126  ORF Transcript_56524/g.115126 Transcript_56524/m.115126 type:complete len:281 (-) Transcript_56524:1-843(-)